MTLTFTYNPNFEYRNFRASFGSKNHAQPSPRQELFFKHYPEVTPENAADFTRWFFYEHGIDPDRVIVTIRQRWQAIETEFFRRADRVYGRPLPQESLAVYLTAHDRCSYNYDGGFFFIHTNLTTVTKTIMHELWHWYFFANFGAAIRGQYGPHVTNDIKEALTVLLNELCSDLMPGVKDVGYPQHLALRQTILEAYRQTQDIKQTIDRSVTTLA